MVRDIPAGDGKIDQLFLQCNGGVDRPGSQFEIKLVMHHSGLELCTFTSPEDFAILNVVAKFIYRACLLGHRIF